MISVFVRSRAAHREGSSNSTIEVATNSAPTRVGVLVDPHQTGNISTLGKVSGRAGIEQFPGGISERVSG